MNSKKNVFLPTGNYLIECEVDICEDAHDPLQEVCGNCSHTKGEHYPPSQTRATYQCPEKETKTEWGEDTEDMPYIEGDGIITNQHDYTIRRRIKQSTW